jgi:hypothetical protein
VQGAGGGLESAVVDDREQCGEVSGVHFASLDEAMLNKRKNLSLAFICGAAAGLGP